MESLNKENELLNASMNAHTEVVKLLLTDSNIDVNFRNKDKETPLLLASKNRHTEVVKILLDAGANHNVVDKNGETPLCKALKRKCTSTTNLLESWPQIVPLKTLCLRTMNVNSNTVTVPTWLPPVLLEWPSIEEVTWISTERPTKRQK